MARALPAIVRPPLGGPGGGRDADEADLRRDLEIARQQQARSLELRAARDLASVLAARGERRQAHDLLAPANEWFTEGFDTPDLKEAKALIDNLRASS
jgi:predicted ATPase